MAEPVVAHRGEGSNPVSTTKFAGLSKLRNVRVRYLNKSLNAHLTQQINIKIVVDSEFKTLYNISQKVKK